MPGSLFRRVAGTHVADLQNKYQKNVRETVIVLIQRKDRSADSEADFSTLLKMEGLLKMLSKYFLPKPKAFLPLRNSEELTVGLLFQGHTGEEWGHSVSDLKSFLSNW